MAKTKTAIEISGIATPFNRSLDSLQRFCRPLLFHKDHDVYDLAYSGSSFLFRCRERNFVLSTSHQLRMDSGNFQPDQICIVIDEGDGKVGLSPDGANRVRIDSYDDKTQEDILLIEYASERNGRNIAGHFLRIDLENIPTLSNVAPEKIVLIFAIGYPSCFSDYDVCFDDSYTPVSLDIVNRWCKLYLEAREPGNWDLHTRIPMKIHHKHHADVGDPNGFSGSPVFFIWQDEASQTHLGFAGMITHGNKGGNFQIYDADVIKLVLKQILDDVDPTVT